ncbi:alcohol dehydrogenase [Microbacterium sp. CH12i]|uniref:zinc-binding dehydrogenase n=1 Tax=Microbacterium sp. CH12i TaxID=1479651 RepID=UPI0004616637|nr:zinc-binding dehydrogenase [Microbacterium sp. CH12i]KDA06736.1 alcohol dehydrogenase [Microbacterium sp. CH12i]
MKASIAFGLGLGFTPREVSIADPRGREVLIEVRASGLCHSDVHLAQTDFGIVMPAVFGHEAAGIVAAIGPDVTTIDVGDHVVACLVQYCGLCADCVAGRPYACNNKGATLRGVGMPPRVSFDEGPLNQVYGIGGFAEQALVHENQLAVVNKQIPFPQASILGCATVTGAGAAINSAQVRVGDTVAVIGTGGVGLNTISGARIAGALRIIAIDIDDTKLRAAKRFGATDTVNGADVDAVQAVLDLTNGGVDHAFEVIGLEATQQQAVQMVRSGGGAYFVGLAKPDAKIELPSSLPMLRAHNSVVGVHMGSTNPKHDIPLYADLYVQGRLNLDDLVSQEISLGDIDDAYEQLARGGVIRSVITSF